MQGIQCTIWDRMERERPPGLKRVEVFLKHLQSWDRPLIQALDAERGHGRDDYPVRAMWQLIAVGLYLRRGRFSELVEELRRNSDLARLLGFRNIGPNHYRTPAPYVVSRFYAKLQQPHLQPLLQKILEESVQALQREVPTLGQHSALDASDVRTHAHAGYVDRKGVVHKATDTEASWSVKTKRWEDGQGKVREEKQSTFGYKLYALVDTEVPAILSIETTTGSQTDQDKPEPMLLAAQAVVGRDAIKTLAMDKGFDSEDNVSTVYARGVMPIVPVREVPDNLQQLPAEDREVTLTPHSNIVYDRYSGEVACYECSGSEPIRHTMLYAGFEADRETHKFRCPLAALQQSCPGATRCSAGSCGTLGRQVRVPMQTDLRRFAPIYPRSHHWHRRYDGRTAVERVNSYLKEVLRLEDHCLRGKDTLALRVQLAAITLNVRTLMSLQAQQETRQRSKPAA